MTAPAAHEIELEQLSPTRWRALCSCGQYKSAGWAYRGGAESAWESHVRSKKRNAS
jgi:hypothetical protein